MRQAYDYWQDQPGSYPLPQQPRQSRTTRASLPPFGWGGLFTDSGWVSPEARPRVHKGGRDSNQAAPPRREYCLPKPSPSPTTPPLPTQGEMDFRGSNPTTASSPHQWHSDTSSLQGGSPVHGATRGSTTEGDKTPAPTSQLSQKHLTPNIHNLGNPIQLSCIRNKPHRQRRRSMTRHTPSESRWTHNRRRPHPASSFPSHIGYTPHGLLGYSLPNAQTPWRLNAAWKLFNQGL